MTTPIFIQEIAEGDYYQYNYIGKSLGGIPTYFIDVTVTRPGAFQLQLASGNKCLTLKKMMVLGPNGRVVPSRSTKQELRFTATANGKHVIKLWVSHGCSPIGFYSDKHKQINLHSVTEAIDYRTAHDALFTARLYSLTDGEISLLGTGLRVYSLLGVSRDGPLFKGGKTAIGKALRMK